MPKQVVKITATRHMNNPNDSNIVFSRTFKWQDKTSFSEFIDDYLQGMMARLYRIAGDGSGITGSTVMPTDENGNGLQRMVTL